MRKLANGAKEARMFRRVLETGGSLTLIAWVLVLLIVASGVAHAQEALEAKETGSASLSYKGLVSAVSQEREFDFAVRQPDGKVKSGPVRIRGIEGFSGDLGDVDWRVSGSRVTGTMTKHGSEVATFEGTIGTTEISGTFRTPDGHAGSWTAPLEQQ
jgi:hypothetical protein